MVEIIARARRNVSHELSVRLGFSERVTIPCSDANYIDRDLDEDLWVGLIDCPSLNVIKMLGAICNPLFQNN